MFNLDEVKKKMTATVDHFRDELKKVRTGRAHPDMLADIKVEAYGQMTPLNQVANVTVSGASMLLITPYDVANIPKISSAIRADQSLGLNPSDDGRVVRVPIPPLNEERRREIVKTASTKLEQAKISFRQARDDARKAIKSAELPEDEKKRTEKSLDDLIKDFTSQIEKLFSDKESEIMKV